MCLREAPGEMVGVTDVVIQCDCVTDVVIRCDEGIAGCGVHRGWSRCG